MVTLILSRLILGLHLGGARWYSRTDSASITSTSCIKTLCISGALGEGTAAKFMQGLSVSQQTVSVMVFGAVKYQLGFLNAKGNILHFLPVTNSSLSRWPSEVILTAMTGFSTQTTLMRRYWHLTVNSPGTGGATSPTPHVPFPHPACLSWYSVFLLDFFKRFGHGCVPPSALPLYVGIHCVGCIAQVYEHASNVRGWYQVILKSLSVLFFEVGTLTWTQSFLIQLV